MNVAASLTYAGGFDEKNYTFVLGEQTEVGGADGSWVALVRYDAQGGKDVATWPKRPVPGVHRGVAITSIVGHSYGPPEIDIFALAKVEDPTGEVRTYTIAFFEEDGGDLGIHWTQEFDRVGDDLGDTVPIAISADYPFVATIAKIHAGTDVAYGLNVYDADNGKKVMVQRFMVNGSDVPVDVLVKGTHVYMTGHSTDLGTGQRFVMTAGWDITTGEFLSGWDPTQSANAHLRIARTDRHCEPVRMFEIFGDDGIVITGRAEPKEGIPGTVDVLTFCYNPPPSASAVRWLHQYDSGGDDVVEDGTAVHEIEETELVSKVWVTGTRWVNGMRQMQLIQYNNLSAHNVPGEIYPWVDLDWNGEDARWPLLPDPDLSAEGYIVRYARDERSHANRFKPHVAGRVQRDGLTEVWDFGLWKYNRSEPVPTEPKSPEMDVIDPDIGTGAGNIPVGLDVRLIDHGSGYKAWFTGTTQSMIGNQWYTAQWDVLP